MPSLLLPSASTRCVHVHQGDPPLHLLALLLALMLLAACTTQMGGKGSSVDYAEDTASSSGLPDTATPPDTGPTTPPDSGLDSGSGADTAEETGETGETGGGEETGGGGCSASAGT